ncbi:unnamed protein product [Mesocestoides corti]|uniref:PCI domain-containing protein n=2 Tax=Mesocestoides corti TaxID=53468 RepID=A0A158QUF7_MESCO|nr:unnamed protein product [Mesocestoides corti]
MEETPAGNISIHVGQNSDAATIDGPVEIDLTNYASGYSGFIKYQRLLFIAQRCPALKNKALNLAHDYIKAQTLDITSYEHIFGVLKNPEDLGAGDNPIGLEQLNRCNSDLRSDSDHPPAQSSSMDVDHAQPGEDETGLVYDPNWVEKTCSRVMRHREELETELKNYKANSIKECIRKGYIELGDFCLKIGELGNALKYYTRSRDYCTSRQQDLKSCLSIIKVAVYQGAWSHVSAYVTLAENICESQENESMPKDTGSQCLGSHSAWSGNFDASSRNVDLRPVSEVARTELAIAAGLAKLISSSFHEAATHFLQANCEPDDSNSEKAAPLVTASDLAFYVTLCSLAAFDRTELRSRVLNSPSFRLVLESEVHCRDLLMAFHSADYANCLNSLAKVKNLLKLDIFLADRVNSLYEQIRVKALCQYFTPYISADLNMMAAAFGTTVTDLENELAILIQKGCIKGRIDSHKQLLCALSVDQRCQTFATALQLIDECHRRCQAAILRSNLMRHGYMRGWSLLWQYDHRFEYPGLMVSKAGNT